MPKAGVILADMKTISAIVTVFRLRNVLSPPPNPDGFSGHCNSHDKYFLSKFRCPLPKDENDFYCQACLRDKDVAL